MVPPAAAGAGPRWATAGAANASIAAMAQTAQRIFRLTRATFTANRWLRSAKQLHKPALDPSSPLLSPTRCANSVQQQLDVVEGGDQRHADHQREADLEPELLSFEPERTAAHG